MGDIVVSEEYLRKTICEHCAMSHRAKLTLSGVQSTTVKCNEDNKASDYCKCQYLEFCVNRLKNEPVQVTISRSAHSQAMKYVETNFPLQSVLNTMIRHCDANGGWNVDS